MENPSQPSINCSSAFNPFSAQPVFMLGIAMTGIRLQSIRTDITPQRLVQLGLKHIWLICLLLLMYLSLSSGGKFRLCV